LLRAARALVGERLPGRRPISDGGDTADEIPGDAEITTSESSKYLLRVEGLKYRLPRPEYHRHDVHSDPVDQPECDGLPADIAGGHGSVAVPRELPGERERGHTSSMDENSA
jgi:hypothetical protein